MSISMKNLSDRVSALEQAKSSIDFKVDTTKAVTISNEYITSTSGIIVVAVHDTRYNNVSVTINGRIMFNQTLVGEYREPISAPIPVGRNQLVDIHGSCTCTFIPLTSA